MKHYLQLRFDGCNENAKTLCIELPHKGTAQLGENLLRIDCLKDVFISLVNKMTDE